MGSSSKGSQQTQNTTQTSTPPSWAIPLYKTYADQALSTYNAGEGNNTYQGQRVADLSDTTQNAISGLANTASNYATGVAQNTISQPTASAQNLAELASGNTLSEGNPYYKERLNSEISDMMSKVNSQMSGAGRYGSGAHSGVLADTASSMLLEGLESDYNTALSNMISANSQIDQANSTQANNAANYLNSQSSAYKNALEGGQVQDSQAQDQLSSDWEKWSEEDNESWSRLNLLSNAMAAAAGQYGTTTGQTTSKTNDGILGLTSGLSRLIKK